MKNHTLFPEGPDTYKNTIDDKSIMILTTDSDYYKYLKSLN